MKKLTISVDPALGKAVSWIIKLLSDPIFAEKIKEDQMLFASAYAVLFPFFPELIPTKIVEINTKVRQEIQLLSKELERFHQNELSSSYLHLLYQGCMIYEKLFYENQWSQWDDFLTKSQINANILYSAVSTSIEKNVSHVGKTLNLQAVEKEVLEFQVLKSYALPINFFFQRVFALCTSKALGSKVWSIIFGAEVLDVLSPNSQLIISGLVKLNQHNVPVGLSGGLIEMFCSTADRDAELEEISTEQGFFAQIIKSMQKKRSAAAAIGTINNSDKEIINELFQSIQNTKKLKKTKKVLLENVDEVSTSNSEVGPLKGINILLYGSKSIDKKTTIYEMLIEDGKFNIFSLVTKNVPRGDLATRLYIAQRYLASLKNINKTILIIEEAGSILSQNLRLPFFMGFSQPEKNDDDENTKDREEMLLMDNPIPSIWVVHDPEQITEENVGRFLFHAEVKPASRTTRKLQIENIIKDLNLSSNVQTYLSKYAQLSFNQVKSAARLAHMVGKEIPEQEEILKKGVLQSQLALKREQMEELRDSVTQYSLDYVNVKNAFTPYQIIEALKKRPQGTICLYGLPGAGKTQYAEYLALQLDKPIIMKRASDLLSKWVGENEQNIAAMFRQAMQENAILFLDEADSFLRDRSQARAEWSVTQVNELLQQMERFQGIFICATNLFKAIDPAALRRFTFKLEFLALTTDQRWKMFENEAIGTENYTTEQLSTWRTQLNNIQYLAPGDFATVKRQSNILQTNLNPDEWILQLKQEAKDKLDGIERNGIGFSAPM